MAEPQVQPDERRKFPRLRAPILYSEARLLGPRRTVLDVSLGGVRIYSDDRLAQGRRLDLELLLPPGTAVRAVGKVAWIVELPADAPARYEVGIAFLSFPAEHVLALHRALEQGE